MKTELIKFLAFTFMLLFFTSFMVKKSENDWTADNLKGNVKSYTEVSFKAIKTNGIIKSGQRERASRWERDEKIVYNNKGYIIEEISFESNGDIWNKYIFKYDDKLDKIVSEKYRPDGSLSITTKYTHNYDKNGNKIESKSYNLKGELFGKNTYSYDNKGNQIEYNSYDDKDHLSSKYTYVYDKKGNWVIWNWFDSKEKLTRKETAKYDINGNMIERKRFGADGKLNWKWTALYDDKGNEIEKTEYDSGGNIENSFNYSYQYDKKGNWTKKVELKNKIPNYVLIREYEYFK